MLQESTCKSKSNSLKQKGQACWFTCYQGRPLQQSQTGHPQLVGGAGEWRRGLMFCKAELINPPAQGPRLLSASPPSRWYVVSLLSYFNNQFNKVTVETGQTWAQPLRHVNLGVSRDEEFSAAICLNLQLDQNTVLSSYPNCTYICSLQNQ